MTKIEENRKDKSEEIKVRMRNKHIKNKERRDRKGKSWRKDRQFKGE